MIRLQSRVEGRRITTFALATILCALLAVTVGCTHTTPEQGLRSNLSALQAAIEARDAGGLQEFLSEDFIGNDGLDRESARRLAMLHFMRNDQVGMTLGPAEVAVQGEHATVRCTVVLTGGNGGLLPRSGRIYGATSGWRREGDAWKMTSLAWVPQ